MPKVKNSVNSANEDSGNTGTESSKQSNACIKYCWTYNNYSDENLGELNKVLIVLGKQYIYGFEKGESGTRHLQGWIRLNKKMRITELKKYEILKTIHFEQQKGNDEQAIKYCMKDGKYHANFDLSKYEPEEELEIISDLYPWQETIQNIISKEADKRHVYWIWETTGNVGKSTFCKYLCHKYNAIYIDEGKKADLINIIYNVPKIGKKSIITIDIPRNNGNSVSYKAIEQIKNGMICNTKYETGMKLFNSPHIIIFSNCYPEKDKLSADRWKIGKIENNNIIWE